MRAESWLISRPDTATLPVVAALHAATAGHEGLAATHDLVFRLALSLHSGRAIQRRLGTPH
jgi:hypothetical protein